jgi:tetratricopeptide (TPR) repeat protein
VAWTSTAARVSAYAASVMPNRGATMKQAFFPTSIISVLMLISGCSAVGVVKSSDPHQKLADADRLVDQNRPTAAERLIVESLSICKEANDQLCFADAYRMYGLFFMSNSFDGQWKQHYIKNGFTEPSVNLENRYSKAIEYLQKSRSIYTQTANYDIVSNLSLNMGFAYEIQGDNPSACTAYDESLRANAENVRINPSIKIVMPEKYGTFENYIQIQKNRALCKSPA